MHLLARTIYAAIGISERVNRARRISTLDATIGEVEGAGRKIKEGIVTPARLGDERGRCQPALSRLEAGVETGVAAAVGLRGRQNLIVASNEPHVGVDHRRGGGER